MGGGKGMPGLIGQSSMSSSLGFSFAPRLFLLVDLRKSR
ncbi:hypothetical protein FEMY_20830 [Ferrovum myxofaciens]|uniref:Uncharacterized protein n=1 Tax=Ferrovum myxofaciens TaxID=416213 RepID=A0A149VVY8_9PROT|nr:hypothetical protein FEMY_20830 [Ferrovum myxofaciens]